MKAAFADTFYYLALLNSRDQYHVRALNVAESLRVPTITTEYVLSELLDGFLEPEARTAGCEWVRRLRTDPDAIIVEGSSAVWEEAFQLYSHRLDKDWSLTDCASFVVMKQRGMTEALTHDHHFKQAGFRIIL